MTGEHPFVGWVVVVPVVHRLRRDGSRISEREHFRGDEGGVVAIGDRDYAKCADNDWKCVHSEEFLTSVVFPEFAAELEVDAYRVSVRSISAQPLRLGGGVEPELDSIAGSQRRRRESN